jgi:hypothetical protein
VLGGAHSLEILDRTALSNVVLCIGDRSALLDLV